MTHNPSPILCCDCSDCFVDRPGDTCGEYLAFRAGQPVWPDEPHAHPADMARDRCHVD